ncbi:hypothetical protein TNCV_2250951 [Trichonephila clavipes]|nr:hypothetical protein TNCV_2250951 [Trichonephila clavipes]
MQNRQKVPVVEEKCRDLYAWEEEEALCKIVERVLLAKLFYENKGNASAVVREMCRRKSLLRGPISTKGIRAMIKSFEETGKLGVQPGRGRKCVIPVLIDGVKTADAQSQTSEFGGSSTRVDPQKTGYSYRTIQKVLRKHNALLLIRDPPNPGAA